jgi:hypothetical protein
MITPDPVTVTAPQHTPNQPLGGSTGRRITAQRPVTPASCILDIFAGDWASTHWSSLKPRRLRHRLGHVGHGCAGGLPDAAAPQPGRTDGRDHYRTVACYR